MEAKSSNNIIDFGPKDYMELVVENPRPYDVIMLYSVPANCEPCDDVFNELQTVVYSITKQRD